MGVGNAEVLDASAPEKKGKKEKLEDMYSEEAEAEGEGEGEGEEGEGEGTGKRNFLDWKRSRRVPRGGGAPGAPRDAGSIPRAAQPSGLTERERERERGTFFTFFASTRVQILTCLTRTTVQIPTQALAAPERESERVSASERESECVEAREHSGGGTLRVHRDTLRVSQYLVCGALGAARAHKC